MARRSLAWMLAVLLLAPIVARAEETLDEAAQHMDDLVRQYRTIRYKVQFNSQMTVNNQVVKGSQEMNHEVLRLPNGRALTRYETRGKVRRQVPGKPEQVSETYTLSIFDGRYLYDLRQTPQRVYAVKSQPERNPHDPVGRLAQAREQFEVRLLSDQTFEGKEVYAIEFAPKSSETNAVAHRIVSYTDHKTGLPIKTISYDNQGRVVSTATVVESHLNEDISADRFAFHAPPGVAVMDMTDSAGAPATQSQPAAPATQSQPGRRSPGGVPPR